MLSRSTLLIVCLASACNTGLPIEEPAPACTSTIPIAPPGASTVSGRFWGQDFDGVFCQGGLTAYIDETLDSTPSYFATVSRRDGCSVRTPANISDCSLSISVALGSTGPTTVSSAHADPCDRIMLATSGAGDYFIAQTNGPCGTTAPFTALGSWSLTIDSIAVDAAASTSTDTIYLTHGSMTGTLVSASEADIVEASSGPSSAQLAITF